MTKLMNYISLIKDIPNIKNIRTQQLEKQKIMTLN